MSASTSAEDFRDLGCGHCGGEVDEDWTCIDCGFNELEEDCCPDCSCWDDEGDLVNEDLVELGPTGKAALG